MTDDASFRNQYTWAIIAVVCAAIIATGIYFGLRHDRSESIRSSGDSSYSGESSSSDDVIVYVTRTGQCYHRGSCSYLRSSKIPMKLNEAKRRYRPCSRCGPPR